MKGDWEERRAEVAAKMADEGCWPAAVSWMEEMWFGFSLRDAASEEMSLLIQREKRRRLESGVDRGASFADIGIQIVLSPTPAHEHRSSAAHFQGGVVGPGGQSQSGLADQFQHQNTRQECAGASLDQSEFATLEGLFPLFWRLMLEGRFSHLAGDLGIGKALSGHLG